MFSKASLIRYGLAPAFCAGVALFAGPASGQTILVSDQFERVTGFSDPVDPPNDPDFFSDWGIADNGLGGTLTDIGWITTPDRTTGGGINQTVEEADSTLFLGDADNEGRIRFGAVALDYDLATDPAVLDGGGFTVDFTYRRLSGGFVTFWLGTDPELVGTTSSSAAFLPVTSLSDAGEHVYLFQDDGAGGGQAAIFENGTQLDPPGNLNNTNGLLNGAYPFSDLAGEASILVDAPNGLDNGDEITVSLTLDGISIPDATHTVTLGDFGGTIGFSSNNLVLIDDFVLTALGEDPGDGLIGDYSDDDFVGQADLDLVLANFGSTTLPAGFNAGNTTVGSFDGLIG
ncbi:MAG: hypothetical protein AAF333_18620, partial [Planctomycetota bacterium]